MDNEAMKKCSFGPACYCPDDHDQPTGSTQPEHFSYNITPRAEHLGGGWRLQLFEGDVEAGGGICPVADGVTRDDAYAEALEDGEAWLASRGASKLDRRLITGTGCAERRKGVISFLPIDRTRQSPAPIPEQAASIEGLTNSRIIEIANAEIVEDYAIDDAIDFARAIEREVLATQSAKQGAQPSDLTDEQKRTIECMDSWARDKSLPLYSTFLAQAAPEQGAQVQADVRDQALAELIECADAAVVDMQEWMQTYGENSSTAMRVKKLSTAIRAMKSNRAASTAPALYTRIDKGGEYELLGEARGAGRAKGSVVSVYRDTTTLGLFYRSVDDFSKRMRPVRAASTDGDQKGGAV